MSRTQDPTTPVRHALKRLRVSDTPLKRKNARRALKLALEAIQSGADTDYPALRRDGSAIVRRKPKGTCCPRCNAPMRSWSILVDHLARNHRTLVCVKSRGSNVNIYKCSCGYTGDRPKMARHLSGQSNIIVHFAETVFKNSI